ncbi:MAG: right-handed parallel beta-helix repeat-containing protein [Bryobacteraceae bacterium]|nr:right-handed parallel beta-helix repeat-containing protein [Bryobacteraceae bacterium]
MKRYQREIRLFTSLLFGSLVSLSPLPATDFFVAPVAVEDADGSFANPWSIETALKHPQALNPGDTLYLRGGLYSAPDRLLFRSRVQGADGKFITIRPWRRERVRIDGGLEVLGAWAVYQELEIFNSRTLRITAQPGPFPSDIVQPAGITVYAPNVKVVNNIIHDTSTGLASWKDASDNEFYGNIVYNNGWMGPDRPHGHGAYMQNKDGHKLLIDNVVFNQFELGLQIYGTSNTFLNNFYLEGNILFNNGSLGGAYSRNLLLGGTIRAASPVVRDNITYFPTNRDHGGENNIGYYAFGAGCSDLRLENNYFISGSIALTLFDCTVSSFRGNTLLGSTRAFSSSTYPSNTYLRPADRPSGARVFVRPNRWERGRAHVAVFNWDRADRVSVDLSGTGLEKGDLFEIRDIQALDGRPVLAGIYDGQKVSIPMTSTAVTAPIGTVPNPLQHTDREFGVFLVRKSGAATRTESETLGLRLEAETASLSQGSYPVSEPAATGGCAIGAMNTSALAAIRFELPLEDEYAVWLRVRAPEFPTPSFAASFDDGWTDLSTIPSGTMQWQWVRLNGEGESPDTRLYPRISQLTAGQHTLNLKFESTDLMLDSIYISNDLYSVPPELVSDSGAMCVTPESIEQ